MWTCSVFCLAILGFAASTPALVANTDSDGSEYHPISEEDRECLRTHTPTHRVTYPSNFKFYYVAQDGSISPHTKPSTGHWIKIIGTPHTADNVLYVAALEIYKMMKLAPAYVFNQIAQADSGVGIWTSPEVLTIFPEFKNLADRPECHNRCDGACSGTCTFDGRKYESLTGVTNSIAVVRSDIVMCQPSDPYHHHDNILIHEFAHVVERYGFNTADHQNLQTAYNHAVQSRLWRANSYAMANKAEYFGEGTGAYFLVNMQSTTGGMTDCSYGQCRSIADARAHMKQQDVQLYNLLTHIYTNNRPDEPTTLKTCYVTA